VEISFSAEIQKQLSPTPSGEHYALLDCEEMNWSVLMTSLYFLGKGLKNIRHIVLVLHGQFDSECLLGNIHHVQNSIFTFLTLVYLQDVCGYAHHAVPIHEEKEVLVSTEL
jgi:hypothetical protein